MNHFLYFKRIFRIIYLRKKLSLLFIAKIFLLILIFQKILEKIEVIYLYIFLNKSKIIYLSILRLRIKQYSENKIWPKIKLI